MSATAAEYQRYEQQGGLADLSTRAKFRLTGPDRVRYLNGQVTANVTKLSPDAALPACVTTAKGKLCGEVFISAPSADALCVDTEPELREPLLERLGRYIIADDVTLEDATLDCALLHFLRLEPPLSLGGQSLRATRFGPPGWDVWLPLALWQEARPQFAAAGQILSPDLLETLRLEAGVPRWGSELGPDTLPPEAGLDRTHIDYAKGCYIGQETISRLRSVGHVNRELLGFQSLDGEPLAPGMRLFSPADETKPVGLLTSAGWSFALAKPIALGYLKRGAPAEGLQARPAHAGSPALEIAPRALPFRTP